MRVVLCTAPSWMQLILAKSIRSFSRLDHLSQGLHTQLISCRLTAVHPLVRRTPVDRPGTFSKRGTYVKAPRRR